MHPLNGLRAPAVRQAQVQYGRVDAPVPDAVKACRQVCLRHDFEVGPSAEKMLHEAGALRLIFDDQYSDALCAHRGLLTGDAPAAERTAVCQATRGLYAGREGE
jgi:hypothetical protein